MCRGSRHTQKTLSWLLPVAYGFRRDRICSFPIGVLSPLWGLAPHFLGGVMKTIVMKKNGSRTRLLSPMENQCSVVINGKRLIVHLADGWKHFDAMLRCGWRATRVQ